MPSDNGLFAFEELMSINLPSMYILTKLLCEIFANQPSGTTSKWLKLVPLTQNLGEELYDGMSDEALDGAICWPRTVVASNNHRAVSNVLHERKEAIVYACIRVVVYGVKSLSLYSGVVFLASHHSMWS